MKIFKINSPTHGKHNCLLDDDIFNIISEYKWHIIRKRKAGTFYAESWIKGIKKRMHRFVYEIDYGEEYIKGKMIDHIDRNGRNNQRSNLRIANHSENGANYKKDGGGYISKHKGVTFSTKGWHSSIKKNGKASHIGLFKKERDAAIAYDIIAEKVFGEFAVFNIKECSKEDFDRVYKAIESQKRKGGSSKYLGVYYIKDNKKWGYQVKNREGKIIGKYDFLFDLEAAVAREEYILSNNLDNNILNFKSRVDIILNKLL